MMVGINCVLVELFGCGLFCFGFVDCVGVLGVVGLVASFCCVGRIRCIIDCDCC